MIEQKTFREHLYYRLNGLVVKLPPLRDRTDLEALAQRLLRCHGAPPLSPSVMQLLRAYDWPGNVRQLANVLRTAAVMAAGEPMITEEHLSDDFLEDARAAARRTDARLPCAATPPDPGPVPAPPAAAVRSAEASGAHDPRAEVTAPAPADPVAPVQADVRRTLEEIEIETIRLAVEAAKGNISEASKRLGISRNTIYRKLRWKRTP